MPPHAIAGDTFTVAQKAGKVKGETRIDGIFLFPEAKNRYFPKNTDCIGGLRVLMLNICKQFFHFFRKNMFFASKKSSVISFVLRKFFCL